MSKTPDRKKTAMHPYDERERMELILSTLNTGLVLLDLDFTVIWANAMIWKMFPDDNLYGKKCYVVAENRTDPCDGCQALVRRQHVDLRSSSELHQGVPGDHHGIPVPEGLQPDSLGHRISNV